MSKVADELRIKARELLEMAEKLDGKHPHVLVVTGGNFDEPTVAVSWSKRSPSARNIGNMMGFDNDGDHEFFSREMSLFEFVS